MKFKAIIIFVVGIITGVIVGVTYSGSKVPQVNSIRSNQSRPADKITYSVPIGEFTLYVNGKKTKYPKSEDRTIDIEIEIISSMSDDVNHKVFIDGVQDKTHKTQRIFFD